MLRRNANADVLERGSHRRRGAARPPPTRPPVAHTLRYAAPPREGGRGTGDSHSFGDLDEDLDSTMVLSLGNWTVSPAMVAQGSTR